MREELKRLCEGLRTRDRAVCGAAPEWIIGQVLIRFDETLARLTPENESAEVDAFARGAVRYINDQCGYECDTLGNALFELVRSK